ncbi:hypothetical protein KR044_001271 [Drosophila immigrans]|nr:hypothetical protein KR044_001271 [Drosophila immigrans]
MKNKMNSNLKTSTIEELSPIAEPTAASTPEGIADTSSTSLRRSLRIKQPKIPCACCTTGMHVRCYTNVEGRRPIHSPRAVRRSLKRTPRVNATAAVERFSSARNNAGLKRNLDYIKRRRPLFKGGSERKV